MIIYKYCTHPTNFNNLIKIQTTRINSIMTSRIMDINCYDTTKYVKYKRSRLAKDRKIELHTKDLFRR